MRFRLVQPFTGETKPRDIQHSIRIRRLRLPSGSRDNRADLSHLVWRFDPEQCQSRCKHGRHPLNEHKPGFSQLSIILDNEA